MSEMTSSFQQFLSAGRRLLVVSSDDLGEDELDSATKAKPVTTTLVGKSRATADTNDAGGGLFATASEMLEVLAPVGALLKSGSTGVVVVIVLLLLWRIETHLATIAFELQRINTQQ